MKFLKKEIDVIERLEGKIQRKSEKRIEVEYPNYVLTINKIIKGYEYHIREKESRQDYVSKYFGEDIKKGLQKAKDFYWRVKDYELMKKEDKNANERY